MCEGRDLPRPPGHPWHPLHSREGPGLREAVPPAWWWPQFFLLLRPCFFSYLNNLQNHCLFSLAKACLCFPCFVVGLGFVCFGGGVLSIFCTITHFHAAHNSCAALPCLTNLSSNLLFSFFLFMLPHKETNSSEESECDDLDPNTSMEVETIILVIFYYYYFQERVPILKCLC